MTCMRARKSSNFGLIGPRTAESAALERLKKKSPREKRCLQFFSAVLDRILFMLAGNDNINVHESLDEFEIQSDLMYMRAWMSLKFSQI